MKCLSRVAVSAAIALALPAASYAACASYDTNLGTAVNQVRATQTGGQQAAQQQQNDDVSPVEKPAVQKLQQAIQAGCWNLGPQWATDDFTARDGSYTRDQFSPSAPGDALAPTDADVYKPPTEADPDASESSLPLQSN